MVRSITNIPLVSVIVIVYNHESFIRETLDSCIDQTLDNYEIIVCDDGSSDMSPAVINEYAERHPNLIIPVIGLKNSGIAANANRGLKVARGMYIAWLGGDDLMYPNKLYKQVALLNKRLDAVACVHDAVVFQSETGEILGTFSKWANGRLGLKEGGVELWFEQGYHMLPSTVMFRADAAPSHGLDIRLKYTNDWLFDIEAFRHGCVVVLDEVLGKYRRHEANVTGSASLSDIAVEDNLVATSIVEARYPEMSSLARKKRQIVFLGACKKYWSIDRKKAFHFLKAAYFSNGLLSLILLVIRSAWRSVALIYDRE